MAGTGIVLLGFVVGHLAGNLLIFVGPEALDAYSAFLKSQGGILWGARFVLLASLIVHMRAAVLLTMRNMDARPIPYDQEKTLETSYAAQTMIYGGFIIFAYVIFHILHLTLGIAGPSSTTGANFEPHTVYHNVVMGFRDWRISAIYIVANIALAIHLYHGAWSLLQTLGVNHPEFNNLRKVGSALFGIVIGAGFISIPICVMAGVLR